MFLKELAAAVAVIAAFTALPAASGPVGEASKSTDKVFVCYFGSWAKYRPGAGHFDVENIDPYLCTHLIFGFAGLKENKIVALDPYNELVEDWGKGAYRRFVKLKRFNPNLKALIAIGGWNEGSQKYSQMAKDPAARAVFIQSCMEFIEKHEFDGLDMDWEYPGSRDGAAPEDKENFVTLLTEMRAAFAPKGYLLTAAVSAGQGTIDKAYDVPRISELLDLINVMSYDYHGAWANYTHHNAPLHKHPGDDLGLGNSEEDPIFNVEYSIEYWLKLGAPKNKLVMGMPVYGRCFALTRPQESHELFSPVSGPCMAGPYTREGGFLGFNEICEKQMSSGSGFERYWVDEIKAPYAVFQTNQWIGYDDLDAIQAKVDYVNRMGLRGGMVWSVETDDFTGACGLGNFENKKNPVLKTIALGLFGFVPTPDPSVTVPPLWTGRPTPAPDDTCTQTGWNAQPCSNTYYWCQANGLVWEVQTYSCSPPGTVFDVTSSSCKTPEEMGCSGGTQPTTTTTTTKKPLPTTTTTTRPGETTTTKKTTTSTRPVGGSLCSYCSHVGDNVHPTSCTKFLKCWGNVGDFLCQEENCATGLGFHPETGTCTWLTEIPSCSG